METTAEAETEWIALIESSERVFMGNPDCTPGYYNNEGQPIGRKQRLGGSGYPAGPVVYWQFIDQWRTSGEFQGFEFRVASGARAGG